MKKRVLFIIGIIFLLGALPVFAEELEVESEWEYVYEDGDTNLLTFYKNKTFVYIENWVSYDNQVGYEGTFKGDTTKDGTVFGGVVTSDGWTLATSEKCCFVIKGDALTFKYMFNRVKK